MPLLEEGATDQMDDEDTGDNLKDKKEEATIMLKSMVGARMRKAQGGIDTYDIGLGDKHFNTKSGRRKKFKFTVATYT